MASVKIPREFHLKPFFKGKLVATANARMLDAVINSPQIQLGPIRMRILECHLAGGFYAKGAGFRDHKHDDDQIEIPLAGQIVFHVGDRKVALKPAQALVIPAQTPHRWHTPTGGLMLGMRVATGLGAARLRFKSGPAARVVGNPRLTAHLAQLLDASVAVSKSPLAAHFDSSLLQMIVAEVLDAVCSFPQERSAENTGKARQTWIHDNLRTFMLNNLGARLTANDLARQAGIGYRQLTRLFLRHSGESPYQFFLRVRLEHVRDRILKDPLTPIKELAYDHGFVPSTLSLAFRKHFGVSPSSFATRTLAPPS